MMDRPNPSMNTDDWIDHSETSYSDNDGRSATRTTFYNDSETTLERHQLHRDSDNRRTWDEYAQWNDGLWAPNRATQNFEADVGRWIDTFCWQLSLNDLHADKTEYIVQNELEPATSFELSVSMEEVILATISLVFDDLSNQTIDSFKIEDWIVNWDSFQSLMDDVEMERNVLWRLRDKISTQSEAIETQLVDA